MDKYDIKEDYRDDDVLRKKFYQFVDAVFPGLNFKLWHDRGCWSGPYIPFSIIENDQIISNVSITKMKVLLNGRAVDALQFGTVGTIPEYRNRGLSRYLMEYVLDKYKNDIGFYFLFANETVLDFYPKFGFKRYDMSIFSSDNFIYQDTAPARKLDVKNEGDFELIKRTLDIRVPVTKKFGAVAYDFISMWHILNLYPDKLYYFEEDRTIAIASEKEGKFHLLEIVSPQQVDPAKIISGIAGDKAPKSVFYYFSPDQMKFDYDDTLTDEDSPLYIRGNFDIGEGPFRFPATAQT